MKCKLNCAPGGTLSKTRLPSCSNGILAGSTAKCWRAAPARYPLAGCSVGYELFWRRATTRAAQPAKSPQRVRFRCSTCTPRHNKSNPTREKSAGGSLSMFKMCAAPQRATQPAKSPQRVHFRCSKCAPRQKESNPTRQKSAEGSLSMFKMRTAPQREQPNPPKVRRGFTFDVQNAHRATTRAAQPAKSPQRVHFRCSKCAPRHNESNPTRQKSAEGSLSIFKMRTAPRRDTTLRSDMGAAPHGDTKS